VGDQGNMQFNVVCRSEQPREGERRRKEKVSREKSLNSGVSARGLQAWRERKQHGRKDIRSGGKRRSKIGTLAEYERGLAATLRIIRCAGRGQKQRCRRCLSRYRGSRMRYCREQGSRSCFHQATRDENEPRKTSMGACS